MSSHHGAPSPLPTGRHPVSTHRLAVGLRGRNDGEPRKGPHSGLVQGFSCCQGIWGIQLPGALGRCRKGRDEQKQLPMCLWTHSGHHRSWAVPLRSKRGAPLWNWREEVSHLKTFSCVLKFALYLGKATSSFLDPFYHVSLAALGNIFPIKQTNSCWFWLVCLVQFLGGKKMLSCPQKLPMEVKIKTDQMGMGDRNPVGASIPILSRKLHSAVDELLPAWAQLPVLTSTLWGCVMTPGLLLPDLSGQETCTEWQFSEGTASKALGNFLDQNTSPSSHDQFYHKWLIPEGTDFSTTDSVLNQLKIAVNIHIIAFYVSGTSVQICKVTLNPHPILVLHPFCQLESWGSDKSISTLKVREVSNWYRWLVHHPKIFK